jgi:hypothetical protein
MNDEFQDLNSRIPDFSNALINRVTNKTQSDEHPNIKPWVDPYQMMLQRKRGETPIDPATIQQWPDEDVMELEYYCKRNGIVGVSSKMNPKLALMQLKRQVGDYSGVPLEDRVPEGYERRGTPNTYGPNYPYSEALVKKQILHG